MWRGIIVGDESEEVFADFAVTAYSDEPIDGSSSGAIVIPLSL